MASCHRCGARLKRREDGRRKCRGCGFAPGAKGLDRSGHRRDYVEEVEEVVERGA